MFQHLVYRSSAVAASPRPATTPDSARAATRTGQLGRLPWPTARLLVLVVVALAFYLPGVAWGLPSEYALESDAPAPYDALLFVGQYNNVNAAVKYPAVLPLMTLPPYGALFLGHKLVGNFSSFSSTWPYGFKDPYVAFSQMILVRNAMSVAMVIGLLIALTQLPLASLTTRAKYIAVGLLATSGILTYYARVSNPDAAYLFWWALSFLFVARYVYARGSWRRNLVLAAVCSALAIGSKDQAAGLVLGSGVVILLIGRTGGGGRIPRRVQDATLFSACMLSSYLVVAILPQPFRWIQHVKLWLPSSPNITAWAQFPATPDGYAGLLGASLYRLVNDLSPVTLLLAAIGLVVLVRRGRGTDVVLLIVPVLIYYLLIIVPIRFVFERYMLPAAVMAALLAGVGAWESLQVLKVRFGRLASPAVVTVVGATVTYQLLTGYLPLTQMQLADVPRQLSRVAPTVMPPGSNVLFLGGPFLRTLPNSDFYRAYHVMLPEGTAVPARYKHVVSDYDPTVQFVLSDAPLGGREGDLTLLRSFDSVHGGPEKAAVQYFLYRR